MTQTQANKIKSKVEAFNELYAPITLRYQMICTSLDNFAVTITFNYTENEWMEFYGINHIYAQVMDKLDGYQFAMEAVQAYQEEHGNLKFSQSDLPLG
jgi:hypothetical protein